MPRVSTAKPSRRRLLLASLSLVWACVQPAPDAAVLRPFRDEDTRVVRLLTEADRAAANDPRGAAESIRTVVLPVARANADACQHATLRHPLAQSLRSDLRSMLDERVVRLQRYADALAANDPAAQLRETRAQRDLERDMAALDARIAAAERIPPTRGCSRTP